MNSSQNPGGKSPEEERGPKSSWHIPGSLRRQPPEWPASGSHAFPNHILAMNHRGDRRAPSKHDWVKATPRQGGGRVQGWLACRGPDLFHREAGGCF